jgi:DNA (cytosine-5)-methyltransferase 1
MDMEYKKNITFIDLFAGIGGFHLALHELGAECVFASEIDKFARKTYKENFYNISPQIFNNSLFNEDINNINISDIPDFDLLCAGFPCQPFSIAGKQKGFSDDKNNRGNMFFNIMKIITLKKPNALFLENVRNLEKHDNGKTFTTIKNLLKEQGYSVYYQIIKACDFGLPQLRERIFIVAFLDDYRKNFVFPEKKSLLYTMSDIFKEKCNRDIGFTLRVGGRGSKINDRRNWEFYEVGGKIKRIGIKEAKMMMGFPENFIFPVSECQAMKQLGNSVAVLAVKAVAENVINYIKNKVYTSSELLKNNQIFSINDDSNKKDLLL